MGLELGLGLVLPTYPYSTSYALSLSLTIASRLTSGCHMSAISTIRSEAPSCHTCVSGDVSGDVSGAVSGDVSRSGVAWVIGWACTYYVVREYTYGHAPMGMHLWKCTYGNAPHAHLWECTFGHAPLGMHLWAYTHAHLMLKRVVTYACA